MGKGKKGDISKNLSEFKVGLKLLEFLTFVESVKRFEIINGRKPTRDERKNIAKTLHINIDDFCALLGKIFPDKFPIATA